jgi:hypothetical protein
MNGKTTVESYGKKGNSKNKVSILDTPRKKLNLEYNVGNDQELGCLGNCGMMLCPSKIKS